MENYSMKNYIKALPKAELHVHIEGTFEPELLFKIAQRNNISLKYKTVDALKKAYQFNNLQEFLDIYYEGAKVLLTEQDFYDLTYAYFERIAQDNVLHTELFFDPQTHTGRGVSFDTIIKGIKHACQDAQQKFNITYKIIMSFLRHLDEKAAFETLQQALPYKDWIIGVGLDSSELGNPPSKFKNVFAKAREYGFRAVAHAGEEGPAEYIWQALDVLQVDRIDHGNGCVDDKKLMDHLAKTEMALTLCPLSNKALKVTPDLKKHELKQLLKHNIKATINADDPAYFGGYINDNYYAICKALHLNLEQITTIALNSVKYSFLNDELKKQYMHQINACSAQFR